MSQQINCPGTEKIEAMKKHPRVIDLFCGAGGLSLGFCSAGFHLVAGVEIDKIHADTHRKNFPECSVINSDIRKLDSSELENFGDISVVIGGPPCQGFSSGGLRDVSDPRNSLIFEYLRMIERLHPSYFVFENVSGIISGKMFPIFEKFIADARLIGYEVDHQLLSSDEFGVPQKRKRVFIMGSKKGLHKIPKITPATTRSTVGGAMSDLYMSESSDILDDVYSGILGVKSEYLKLLENKFGSNTTGQISGFLRSSHSESVKKRFGDTAPGKCEQISRFYRLDSDSVARTIRAGTGADRGSHTAPRPIHPVFPRCINVREAARIQSFPDWFDFHPTVWHGFRQVGNSVPPLLSRAIADQILPLIGSKI